MPESAAARRARVSAVLGSAPAAAQKVPDDVDTEWELITLDETLDALAEEVAADAITGALKNYAAEQEVVERNPEPEPPMHGLAPSTPSKTTTDVPSTEQRTDLAKWLQALEARPELERALHRLRSLSSTTDPTSPGGKPRGDLNFIRALVYTCLELEGSGAHHHSSDVLDTLTEELCGGNDQEATARSAVLNSAACVVQKYFRGFHLRAFGGLPPLGGNRHRPGSVVTDPRSSSITFARACVFGSLNMDLKAETGARIADGASTVTGFFSASPGGKGGNEALALSRLGIKTFLIGRVGSDEMGSVLLQRLARPTHMTLELKHVREERYLNMHGVTRDENVATGVAVQLVANTETSTPRWQPASGQAAKPDLEKITVTCQGANNAVGEEELAAARRVLPPHNTGQPTTPRGGGGPVTGAPTVAHHPSMTAQVGRGSCVEVLLLQLEIPLEASLKAAIDARSRGCHVVLKASPLPALNVPVARRLLASGAIDHLFVNEVEAPALLGWGEETRNEANRVVRLNTLSEAERAAEATLLRWAGLSVVIVTSMVGM